MFCPNCGQDCGDARFCTGCGTQLKQNGQNEQHTQWRAGMPCPYCGGVGLKGNYCAFCGVQLIFDKYDSSAPFWGEDSYELPKGKCNGYGGYIQLEQDALRLYNKYALAGREVTIPYEQLTQVLYVRAEKQLTANGFLIVRWTGDRGKPLSKGYARRNDKTAINFGFLQDVIFYHIYCLLKTLAPPNAVFQMELPKANIPELDAWAKSQELTACFEKFSPNRKLAAVHLCRNSSIYLPTTTAIINRAFDIRQQELYATEPAAAIRDLNRVIRENSYIPGVYQEI